MRHRFSVVLWSALAMSIVVAGCGGTETSPGDPVVGAGAGGGAGMSAVAGMNAVAGTSAAGASGAAGMSAAGASGAAGMSAAGASGAAGMSTAGASGAAGMTATAGSSGAAAGSGGGAGCGSESFAAIYQSIFADKTNNCSGPVCHGRTDPAGLALVGNLNLGSAQVAYMQLVGKNSDSTMCAGKPRVIAGDPKGSLLVQKLRGDTTTCGGPMPVGADEITDAQLKRITDWISAGACNN